MKRIADTLLDSLLYAFYFFISCLVCMVAEILIIRVIDITVEVSYFSLCVIRALIYTLGVNAILAIVGYREGYKAAHCSVISTVISGVIATAIHFLFSLLFSFEAFCAGGVRFISALVKFGTSLSAYGFKGELLPIDCIAVFFINSLIYCAVIAVAKSIGAKKRVADRKCLTANETSAV